MKIVIFGLTVSSSWGNGHATLWRGLCKGLSQRGHDLVFFERDVPYYAAHRDLTELPGGRLVLYSHWADAALAVMRELADADVALSTSYCSDANAAADLMLEYPALRVFYDLDTPVTLAAVHAGQRPPYLPEEGLGTFDLVLSYTGGIALSALKSQLGAKSVAPLYGSVDPDIHHSVAPVSAYRSSLSYLGTYAEDRQNALRDLFLEPAKLLPQQRFTLGGSKYPGTFPWSSNIYYFQHLPPAEHAAFFCSSRLTLNITRGAMAAMGYCPSGRLFEAAACGVPIITDSWDGLNNFFEPGREICVAHAAEDVMAALTLSDAELSQFSRAARDRVLSQHTARQRAAELEHLLEQALSAPLAA